MLITITIFSILGLTALVRLAEKILPFKVCPICAGVSLTWAWLLAAHFLGYSVDLIVPALLMGGSVVGIAYQLEKKFSASSARLQANQQISRLGLPIPTPSADARLLLKALFIPAGFVAAYAILAELWAVFAGALAFLLTVTFLLPRRFNRRNPDSGGLPLEDWETAEEIEKKMKDCC